MEFCVFNRHDRHAASSVLVFVFSVIALSPRATDLGERNSHLLDTARTLLTSTWTDTGLGCSLLDRLLHDYSVPRLLEEIGVVLLGVDLFAGLISRRRVEQNRLGLAPFAQKH